MRARTVNENDNILERNLNKMKILKVPDMHCEMCVKRIDKALTSAKIAHKISLADKTVSVDEEKTSAAIEILDDLGFSAGE